MFLTELCELLGVEKHRPTSDKIHEAEEEAKASDWELALGLNHLLNRTRPYSELQGHPVTTKDLYRHFKPVRKDQMDQRLQQICAFVGLPCPPAVARCFHQQP